jgi:hypothetical protein
MMENFLCKYVTGGLSQQHVESNLCRYNRSGIVAGEHISEARLSLTDDRAALLPSQSTNILMAQQNSTELYGYGRPCWILQSDCAIFFHIFQGLTVTET